MKLVVSTFSFLFAATAQVNIAGAFIPEPKLLDIESIRSSSLAKPIPSSTDGINNAQPAAKKVSSSKMTSSVVTATNPAIKYKKWGVENTNEDEYWFDSRIHTLGNCGFMGAVHAALAPVSTKLIDNVAYHGTDIRKRVAQELSSKFNKKQASVLDLCCGVGFSTRAMGEAFPDAEKIVGLDTSKEMLAMANFISAQINILRPWIVSQGRKIKMDAQNICSAVFEKGNAEQTPFKDASFDIVTIMYAFHEAPKQGRQRILKEVRRLLRPGGVLAVIDISTEYTPSQTMLAGEPYVIEYQQNIHRQLGNQPGFARAQYKNLVPGHVGMWTLRKSVL